MSFDFLLYAYAIFFWGGGGLGVPVRSTVYIIITFINSCMYKDYSNKKKLTPLNRLISLISWRMVFDLVTSDDDVTIPNKNTNRQTDVVKKSKYRMFLEPIFAIISQNSQNWLSKFTKEFHLQPGTLSREKARMWFFFYSGKKPGCFWFLLLLLYHYEVTLCKVTWESTATRCVNNTTVPSRNDPPKQWTPINDRM